MLSLWLLSIACVVSCQAIQAQQRIDASAGIPEQIRLLLARAVTAMDRGDQSASLQSAAEAGELWQKVWQTEPELFSNLEPATADVAVPLLERLLGRWRAGLVPAQQIADVLQPLLISSDGTRVSVLQSSLKGPGYPFVLENSGASIGARAAVAAGVHGKWIELLRRSPTAPSVSRLIIMWLLHYEADQSEGQADILRQLGEVSDTEMQLRDDGLQLTHIAMCGLRSRSETVQRQSLKLVQKLAGRAIASGGNAVLLRMLRDACITAAPEAIRLDSPELLREFLRLSDFLIEQFASIDDSSPAVRLLTQHYLITSQICLVHHLPDDGLRRLALFRTLQSDTSSLTANDLQFFLPLQAVHSLPPEFRWRLFRMVLDSELWLLTRQLPPQFSPDTFPDSAAGQQQFDLLLEMSLAAVECHQQQWLLELWQRWSAQGDPAATRGLQILSGLHSEQAVYNSAGRPAGWLSDDVPEVAALGPQAGSVRLRQGGMLAENFSRPAVWHFPWPLTGKFRIVNRVAASEHPVTLPGWGGLASSVSHQGTTTLFSSSAAVVRRKQTAWSSDAGETVLQSIFEATDQQSRQLLADAELWSLNAAGGSSPWLFLLSLPDQQNLWSLSIEGTPEIPRQVNLLGSDDLRGWSSRGSGQSQPDVQIDSGPDAGGRPAGAPDWQQQAGMLVARRSLQRSAPLPGFPQEPQPVGRLIYQRPLLVGDRILWEFEHQPGRSRCHPAIGSTILEIHADGIFLNCREPAWWVQLQGFGGRRTPLTAVGHSVPLKTGWNQAELRRTGAGFQLDINGQQQCDFAWQPADARFGLAYARTAGELQVRGIQLRGDWPSQFQPSDFQKLLQSAVGHVGKN